ncbi:hypothetical protein LZ186_21395, partial [Rhodovulum sulfidophilum]|nr:hypothetical protein [Rhodovulum sulfidophilum]
KPQSRKAAKPQSRKAAKPQSRKAAKPQSRKAAKPQSRKAAKNFITLIGDKPISAISGDDMLAFRGWWLDRIDDEGLSANSANKDLIHLGDILKTVNKKKRLGLVLPLSDLSLKEGKARPRLPFSSTWSRG